MDNSLQGTTSWHITLTRPLHRTATAALLPSGIYTSSRRLPPVSGKPLASREIVRMGSPETKVDTPSGLERDARFTVFHGLWLGAAITSGVLAFRATDGHVVVRILIGVAATAVGFLAFLFVVLWLVGLFVIPRTRPGTYWSYEVDCFMRSIIGKKWIDAGERAKRANAALQPAPTRAT